METNCKRPNFPAFFWFRGVYCKKFYLYMKCSTAFDAIQLDIPEWPHSIESDQGPTIEEKGCSETGNWPLSPLAVQRVYRLKSKTEKRNWKEDLFSPFFDQEIQFEFLSTSFALFFLFFCPKLGKECGPTRQENGLVTREVHRAFWVCRKSAIVECRTFYLSFPVKSKRWFSWKFRFRAK